MSSTLGPLPHPVEVSRYTKGEELRITHAYTTAQMEAERLRCYELGVAKERERWKVAAIAACNSAGDGPDNGCCPTYWEDARDACIAAIIKSP